jgi:hypothetical protein
MSMMTNVYKNDDIYEIKVDLKTSLNLTVTIGKYDIFLGSFKFFGTEEYNSDIFLGTYTDEGKGNR